MRLSISNHAIQRYRERIKPLPDDDQLARLELFGRITSAEAKHLRRLGKRTAYIPTKDCLFVFEGRSLVTVLSRDPSRNVA